MPCPTSMPSTPTTAWRMTPPPPTTKLAAKPAKRALAQLAEEWQVSHNLAVNSASALVFDQVSGDAIFQKNAGAVTPRYLQAMVNDRFFWPALTTTLLLILLVATAITA